MSEDTSRISEEEEVKPVNNMYKKVFFDLLATEFARKYKTGERTTTDDRCLVLHSLLNKEADSDAIR